ncbi:uncharacterized protein LOC113329865 [Papaver somniferum]|uniref:uncharacterized protein LOC113329865 n=1 Tax=Papaver somniferum TaxID=3469 RepID=UPI000E6FB51A|nr:uncharacterized protein LOC113329865 [Papaver somniferum]
MGEGDGTNSSGGTKGKDIVYDSPKKNLVYHLGSSGGLGILITPIALKGTNYDEWARAIKRSLIAKRKFGFVDGTIKQPEDPDQLDEWIVFHLVVVSWINNTLDSSIISTLGDYDNASLLWTHLKKRFCVVSGTRICQLKSSLSECKQGKSESVVVYYGRLNKIWDELLTAEQLLARDPLPVIDAAYQTVVNSERLRMGDGLLSKEVQENVMAFKVQPDQTATTSIFRGGRGSGRGGRAVGRGRDGAGLVGVTAAQLQQMLDYLSLNKSKLQLQGKQNRTSWIVDTWDTNHVTCNIYDMIEVKEITACSVGLPDGNSANSDKIGTVILPGGLKLNNVLYVPQITFKVLAVRGDSYELWHQRMGLPTEKFDKEIKNVRSDNGTEFNTLCGYFKTNGNIFETSCVGTSQQNGRVERKHQHIMNVARALRFQTNLSIQFWVECALTASYLINRTPTPLLNNKSPYEIMFGKLPPYDQLRVFGCLCYMHNQNSKGDKLASRGRRCVFLGYPFGKKAWKVYDLDTKQFLAPRYADFYEYQFPYVIANVEQSNNIAPSSIETCWSYDEDREEVQSPGEVIETRQPEMQQQQRSDDTHLGIECATE